MDYELFKTIDPTATTRAFTAAKQAILLTLARQRAVTFVSASGPFVGLDMSPVRRRELTLIEIRDDADTVAAGRAGVFVSDCSVTARVEAPPG